MKNFVHLKQLNKAQTNQYIKAKAKAFPAVINESQIIKNNWARLEEYFPEFQLFLISEDGDLIGFMNTIPFQFNKPLDELPEQGWDWMFTKGVSDYENKRPPNLLGGLQVITRDQYKRLGYSQEILTYAKEVFRSSKLLHLIIPIRPTKKYLFPNMSMVDYLNLKDKNEIADPWIRTHLKSGAQIIKVCERSMSIEGDVEFWETLFNKKITESGEYLLDGALKPITIDVKNNFGAYIEPNIWMKYD